MAQITAADVNKLRQTTGAGMMDCKNALVEAEGDFDKAIDILRKKGQKVADKRSDREAKEGYVVAKANDQHTFAALVSLNCETDFVAKNEEFSKFAEQLADLAVSQNIQTMDALRQATINGRSVQDLLTDMIGKIGEKIDITRFEAIQAPAVAVYNHFGNRLATILGMSKAGYENVGKEIAMQIAAMGAIAIDKDDVDEATIARELEIGKEQARQEGKPEDMLEKIALGKLNKFYKESTLLNQEFIRDNKLTVRQYLEQTDKDLKITAFKRVQLG